MCFKNGFLFQTSPAIPMLCEDGRPYLTDHTGRRLCACHLAPEGAHTHLHAAGGLPGGLKSLMAPPGAVMPSGLDSAAFYNPLVSFLFSLAPSFVRIRSLERQRDRDRHRERRRRNRERQRQRQTETATMTKRDRDRESCTADKPTQIQIPNTYRGTGSEWCDTCITLGWQLRGFPMRPFAAVDLAFLMQLPPKGMQSRT